MRIGLASYIANSWSPVFRGIHQINGIHGTAWGSSSLGVHWENLAHNGFLDGVSYQFVVSLYAENFAYYDGELVDNCPISYTGRNSAWAAQNIIDNEQYDTRDNYGDIDGPTTFIRYYISGCDPAEGPEI
jgi:hypothetical protein